VLIFDTIVPEMSTEVDMLKTLFSTNARARLITHFVTHPKQRFYLRQLERLLSESLTPLRRELVRLERFGLLTSKTEGKQKYYTVNEGFSIYSELKSIIYKIQGIGDILQKNLQKIGTIKFAFIYGSTAEDMERLVSDIDLMIIGDVDIEKLNSVIGRAERSLNREINYSVFTEKELMKRQRDKDDFIMSVLKGKKIMLIGDKNGLLRTAK
jgi:predicted nucleotidyltransferase